MCRMTAPTPTGDSPDRGRGATAVGQFERFTPSRLSDRNGFVEETLAGTGATDGNAPIADPRRPGLQLRRRPHSGPSMTSQDPMSLGLVEIAGVDPGQTPGRLG